MQDTQIEFGSYEKSIHRWGRTWMVIAIIMFLSYPLFTCIYYNTWPNFWLLLRGLFGVAVVFWPVGIIEAFTFAPMLGAGGTYVGFITGNLTNLKVPCGVLALETAKVEANTEEGDVVTTIAVAVSSITTTLILVLGMLLLTQLKPILESPIMAPAFKNILPALFGGLLVVFVAKNPKIAAVPFAFMLILFIAIPQLGKAISMLIPVGAAITIIYTRIMYKKGKI